MRWLNFVKFKYMSNLNDCTLMAESEEKLKSLLMRAKENSGKAGLKYPTLCDPMDCSLPGSIHGIFQARILEWVAISFSRGSSRPRDRTQVSRLVGRCFTIWATREISIKKLRPWHLLPSLHANRWGKSGNTGRFYTPGLLNHCRWWLQPWN